MIELLLDEQKEKYIEFCSFAESNVQPYASDWEREERISRDIVDKCIEQGYLGCTMPEEFNGNGWDSITYGIFTEVIARSSTSLAGLFNVHTMVMQTLFKWGTEEQKNKWLYRMCKGEILGAFALTEPDAGSDIRGIKTKFTPKGDKIVLNGKKRWITFGGLADIFVVFGMMDDESGKPVACIVEKNTPGFEIIPITNMLGFKASYLAVLEFNDCEVAKENIIAKPGFAFSHIAPYALDFGRVSVAFTALGIIDGCLNYCCNHVLRRKTFNSRLIDQSTIKEMITKMGVDYEAASHLCINSCRAKDMNNPNYAEKVMIAKYFTTRAAHRHADNAVQIMGATGCNENHATARYYRDSKVLEIIEGSNQIHEMILGNSFTKKFRKIEKK